MLLQCVCVSIFCFVGVPSRQVECRCGDEQLSLLRYLYQVSNLMTVYKLGTLHIISHISGHILYHLYKHEIKLAYLSALCIIIMQDTCKISTRYTTGQTNHNQLLDQTLRSLARLLPCPWCPRSSRPRCHQCRRRRQRHRCPSPDPGGCSRLEAQIGSSSKWEVLGTRNQRILTL